MPLANFFFTGFSVNVITQREKINENVKYKPIQFKTANKEADT